MIYVGLKTGRDGIHGATFASEELTEESESKRPSYKLVIHLGKKLMEATLEAITYDELVGIQDMGLCWFNLFFLRNGQRWKWSSFKTRSSSN